MEKSLVTNMNLNYVASLFLVLLLAISLSACGSTTVEELNNIVNPPDNSVESPSYEISGEGYADYITFRITTTLSFSQSDLSGEFELYDALSRTNFTSSSINNISISDNTAIISGDIAIDSLFSGHTYELSLTDVDPGDDELVLKIYNPDGTLYIEISTTLDEITSTLTITEI